MWQSRYHVWRRRDFGRTALIHTQNAFEWMIVSVFTIRMTKGSADEEERSSWWKARCKPYFNFNTSYIVLSRLVSLHNDFYLVLASSTVSVISHSRLRLLSFSFYQQLSVHHLWLHVTPIRLDDTLSITSVLLCSCLYIIYLISIVSHPHSLPEHLLYQWSWAPTYSALQQNTMNHPFLSLLTFITLFYRFRFHSYALFVTLSCSYVDTYSASQQNTMNHTFPSLLTFITLFYCFIFQSYSLLTTLSCSYVVTTSGYLSTPSFSLTIHFKHHLTSIRTINYSFSFIFFLSFSI